MNCAKIVVNASPIISLAKIGHADLLLALSSDLVIPQGVVEEIVSYRRIDSAVEWIRRQDPTSIRPVKVPAIIAEWNLGKGESEVIAYAYQHRNFVASLDDKPAKKSAESFGIKVNGTLAIIIKPNFARSKTNHGTHPPSPHGDCGTSRTHGKWIHRERAQGTQKKTSTTTPAGR